MMGLQEVVTWCHLEGGSEFVGGSGALGCWQFVSGERFLQGVWNCILLLPTTSVYSIMCVQYSFLHA